MKRNLPRLRRQKAFRPVRQRVIIYTEGTVTEIVYLRAVSRFQDSLVVHFQPEHGVPRTLLNAAKRFKARETRRFDSASKKDSIWLVFDCDEHPEIESVRKEAWEAGIQTSYSNPCFELWLLLHFQAHDAPDGRHEVQRKLAQVCSSYSTDRKTIEIDDVSNLIIKARERAVEMVERRKQERMPFGNPYTDVYALVDELISS